MKTEKNASSRENKPMIIDATNAVMGRLASYAAKQATRGKKVVIVNVEKAIITGNKRSIIEHYLHKRERVGSSQKGPKVARSPEKILKRTIRGMLPYKKNRGKAVFKSIICYNKVPLEYENEKKITSGKKKTSSYINLEELSKGL
jgi:large subunit ribosomal protein L13